MGASLSIVNDLQSGCPVSNTQRFSILQAEAALSAEPAARRRCGTGDILVVAVLVVAVLVVAMSEIEESLRIVEIAGSFRTVAVARVRNTETKKESEARAS